MLQIERYEIREGHICFLVTGPANMARWVAIHKQAMEICKEHHLNKVMLDTTQVTGPYMNTVDRFRVATEVEKFWDRRMWLALVIAEDQITPDQLGVLSANNRGIRATVFTNQADAATWFSGK
jgi:hypothetical protein